MQALQKHSIASKRNSFKLKIGMLCVNRKACLGRRKIIENYNNEQGIKSLPSISYHERQRQAYATHEPGTGAWFLSHNQFQSWKSSDTTSTLICTGPPGTGKTVLTSLAIDDLARSYCEEDIQVAYLFCQYKHQTNETAPLLFSSILRQLLTSRRVMFPFVRDKCLDLFSKPSVAQNLLKDLVKLVGILAGGTRRTYILVDAVDEVLETDSGGKDVRNEFLRGLSELSHQCRLLVTCRTHIDLGEFSAESTILRIRANDEDLFAYCASTINASKVLLNFCKRRPKLRKEIISAVQERANGVFLLANRHMRRLVSATSARDVQEILKTLSSDLDTVWGFCMERLECQSPNRRALARRALSWVSRALRPLTDIELSHALSYRPGDTDVDPMGCIDVSTIIEVCDGMLHLEPPAISHNSARPVVSFTHATVADYMDQKLGLNDVHLDLANTSLGYLSMEGLRAVDTRLIPHTHYHFLNYAISHWANHASITREIFELEYLRAFARKSHSALVEAARWGLDDALHYLLENGISPNKYHQTQSPLTVAAENGQLLCASYLVEAGANVDYAGDHDEAADTALTHATRSGHSHVVLLLIESNADLDAGLIPPIFAAVFHGRPSIARQLLSAGCDPDVRYKNQTAIMTAVHENRMDIAELLMLGGADLNARYGIGSETLLSTALWYRNWEFAAKLMGKGAAVTHTLLIQILKTAAHEGVEELVQAMLQLAGPGPSHSIEEDDEARTTSAPSEAHKHKAPLHLALEGRHHDIATQLIRSGLGINQLCGNPAYTPLEWTAARNEVELARQLVAAGADPNRGGQTTPLMSAASRFVQAATFRDPESTEMIALLLDAGANPHVHNGIETSQLMTRTDENIRFRWWDKHDPNVRRLLIALQLPESWDVV
ncbi:ankyrin [Clathrospora elynae]|uniref:Ankyrin n=1 Tax=Clathrospora elynae TaxID=706981 RepID=A0A6A5SNC7_9PLEO|nr:ankyrin [Clathrospora elynae]